MTNNKTPPFRADHVGSMLRPKALLAARDRRKKGEITAEELRGIEDAAIKEVMAKQEAVGLQSVTDGEFRRAYFHIDFLEHLKGVVVKGGMPMKFRGAGGSASSRHRAWKWSDESSAPARSRSRTSHS